MPKVVAHLRHLIQDSQEFGSDDEHMVSRVFFDMDVDGVMHRGLYADLKQPAGGSNSDPIEVGRPRGYRGPLNYTAFSLGVERYFRHFVGPTGRGISIQGGANIRMRDNRFAENVDFDFDAEPGEAGW